MSKPIPIEEWKWHGLAGHFICAHHCIFRLHTTVGRYKISTVGAMYVNFNGKDNLDTIGHKRHYETMVFDNEGDEESSYMELEMDFLYLGDKAISSNEEWDKKAEKMHLDMCHKWASKGGE